MTIAYCIAAIWPNYGNLLYRTCYVKDPITLMSSGRGTNIQVHIEPINHTMAYAIEYHAINSMCWLFEYLWSTKGLTHPLTNPLSHRLTDTHSFAHCSLTYSLPDSNWLIGWSVNHCIGWSISQLVGCLVGWVVGWLAGWLVGWLVKEMLIWLVQGLDHTPYTLYQLPCADEGV